MVFIDGTHIKASANKKKFQKEQAAKAAKVYDEQLRKEVAEERKKLGKDSKDDNDKKGGSAGGRSETVTKTVSKTDPDCGMFVKGAHERQLAYEAHTACDRHGFVLGVEVTAGNVHDSVAWDSVYDQVTGRFPQAGFIVMDAGYKTPWIARKTLDDGRIPILPYTRPKGKKDKFQPWEFTYDPSRDEFTCPAEKKLRHTTTSWEGKRTYLSTRKQCRECPLRETCGAKETGERSLTTHIWQESLDLVEALIPKEKASTLCERKR